MGRSNTHKKVDFSGSIPAWVRAVDNPCLQSTAEDVYISKALAESYGANNSKKCTELLRAAEKSLKIMENKKSSMKKRCAEGDRAARKFWEAKACARK